MDHELSRQSSSAGNDRFASPKSTLPVPDLQTFFKNSTPTRAMDRRINNGIDCNFCNVPCMISIIGYGSLQFLHIYNDFGNNNNIRRAFSITSFHDTFRWGSQIKEEHFGLDLAVRTKSYLWRRQLPGSLNHVFSIFGMNPTFLDAAWHKLILANHAVDPALLPPHLPASCVFHFLHLNSQQW